MRDGSDFSRGARIGPSPDLRFAPATLSPEGRGGKGGSASKRTATAVARRLRANETEAEYRLWGELRNRQLNGHKFVRQMPIGPYFVDFLCRTQRLVVELDGAQHAGARRDDIRTTWLNAKGYSVLRFWNNEVLQERRAVLEMLLAVLEGRIFQPCATLRFSPALATPALLFPRGEVAAERRVRGRRSTHGR